MTLRTSRPYPFSVKPDKPVSVEDVMAVMSDVLEGTAFDMSTGLAAGAFGTPDRWLPGAGEELVKVLRVLALLV
jgi:dipeptidase